MSALIHKDSHACAKSELDLFLIPPTQTAIEKGYFVEYHPIGNIRDGVPVEFSISGSGEDYFDLSSSYLYVKAKIVKGDGTDLTDKDHVAPVNLFLHSLFSQVDVSLNERAISSSSNMYPYRAYIETLLNYGEDAKKSLLTCECFYKDENLDVADPTQEQNGNPGLVKRYELTRNSRVVDMIGALHCDIFQQNRLLLNMVDLKIKMTQSKPSFCLMASSTTATDGKTSVLDFKVVLEHASLFIRKTKVTPGVLLGHAKALEKTSAKYPIDRVICKTYSVPSGSLCFMQDNVFLGPIPKRIVIGLLDNDVINGKYGLNPFLFHHHHVNFLSVYIDGNPVPSKPLELNFDSNNYIRAYHSLFSGFNRDSGNFISREEFANGHTLYAFDLSPDLCDGPHLNLQQQGNVRVEIKFNSSLTKTVSVLIYAEFENIIEITKSRHILCDFPN